MKMYDEQKLREMIEAHRIAQLKGQKTMIGPRKPAVTTEDAARDHAERLDEAQARGEAWGALDAYLKAGEPEVPTIDLKHTAYDQMQQAASESKWIPPEYFANDWIADCCRWLREGPPVAEPVPRPTAEQVADAMECAFSDTGEWPDGDAEVVEAWLTHGPAVMKGPRS